MRKQWVWLLFLFPTLSLAQNNISGDWLVTTDVFGIPMHQKLSIKLDADRVTGTLGRDDLQGTMYGNAIHFIAKTKDDIGSEYTATVTGDTISGKAVLRGKNTTTFRARRLPQHRPGPPRRHEFRPTVFYREYSSATKPVLTIWSGDTVHTTTIDAFGTDEHDATRAVGGNPLTGPFYVESAMAGDVLAVHFDRVRLNRDWAISDDTLVGRALGPALAMKMSANVRGVRWHLNREAGVATPDKPGEHLKNYTVPLRPMMGSVGVAPGFAAAPLGAGDSGSFGGNMDSNEIVEGSTVYLPVSQPGALLYVGDGHAVQGDGELNGDALETSMDVEFTVKVLPAKSISTPRVESPTHIIAVGLSGSLDDAFRSATAGLAQWLEQDYMLTPSEVAEVLGTSVEYVVNEVADRNAGIVAKINKERLAKLPVRPKSE